jgi:hypothetical protein
MGTWKSFAESSIDPACGDDHVDGERCQLRRRHPGQHAAGGTDCYLTWDRSGGPVQRWRKDPAPPWLMFLPWSPAFQPPIEAPRRDVLEVDERSVR